MIDRWQMIFHRVVSYKTVYRTYQKSLSTLVT